jgi:hypothetical protein
MVTTTIPPDPDAWAGQILTSTDGDELAFKDFQAIAGTEPESRTILRLPREGIRKHLKLQPMEMNQAGCWISSNIAIGTVSQTDFNACRSRLFTMTLTVQSRPAAIRIECRF